MKSNIGHLESAAGIAALTKMIGQLRHRVLVPSLHAAELNPQLDFAGSPFAVQREVRDWPRPQGGRRTAGVSAFGAGGSNAHIVVEEAPEVERAAPFPGPALFVLSAKDEEALREQARAIRSYLEPGTAVRGGREVVAAHLGVPESALSGAEALADLGFDAAGLAALRRELDGDPDPWTTVDGLVVAGATPRLDDVAYMSRVGREPMRRRFAVVVDSVAALRATLDRVARGAEPEPGEHHGTAGSGKRGDLVAAYDAGRLDEVARAWVAGAEVDWARCAAPTGPARPRRVSLPGHPLREERCWVGGWQAATGVERIGMERATTEPEPVGSEPVRVESVRGEPEPRDVGARPRSSSRHGVDLRVLDSGVALVRLLSPTFDAEQVRLLSERFARVAADPAVRAVVVTGDGPVFCMGAELAELAELANGRSRFTDQSFLYKGLLRCDRPVVTAMQGHAAGGGLAFGLYGDVVVMSADATYGATFVNYGITPGMGATYILERRLGPTVAAELMLTGRSLSGAELARRGAMVRVVPGAEVLAVALDLAHGIAAKPEPAVRALKAELAGRALGELPEIIRREARLHDDLVGEGVAARVREHASRTIGVAAEPAVGPAAERVVERAARPAPAVGLEPAVPEIDEVRDAVVAALCSVLYLDESEVDRSLTFADMGLDSIGAVELVRGLNPRFGTNLDAAAVYDHPMVDALAEAVVSSAAGRARLVASASSEPAAPETDPVVTEKESAPALEAEQPSREQLARRTTASVARATRPLVLAVHAGGERGPIGPEPRGDTRVTLTPVPAARRETAAAAPGPRPDDIAVIGIAGRFPDAPDVRAFWRNVVEGRGSITDVPASRWDVDPWFDPDQQVPDRTNSRWAAMLDRVDEFDAPFFALSPVEAEAMEPQQRLFLQEAWTCLEDAGYGGDRAPGRCGVFVGCGAGDYDQVLAEAGQRDTAHAFLGLSPSILPSRISYLLDLRGPTMAVDTACSSSLTAVHLACESIRRGECESALAGGVAVMTTPRLHIRTSNAGMLSPTGRSMPFDADADADGIVLGEGVGVVLLKPLDAALRDGDHVRAVIRAGGVNGDGRTNGITAPSANAQAELIRSVHEAAGVTAEDIDYVEAHGTGTTLGDPIEVKALHQVFGRDPRRAGRCVLGSVKGSIGHTTMAAGIASLLKVVLALEHATLPPAPWFRTPNPEIDFVGSPFRLPAHAERWPARRRVAAVSSFGFSGTNCHLVVESAPSPPDVPERRAGGRAVV
ncbi:beta-ketoacyl synthase N-terminal-like domain-containing protein, partial [Frankia sp. CcWB2]